MLNTFFGDILPTTGHYCLVLLPEGRHLWANTHDELADLATQHKDRTGVYYGTASFKTTDNRTQANVLALKALRLDIDAGAKKYEKDPDGTYPTQRDALAAVVGFVRDTGLVPSYIVSSGEGLHVYYCLDAELAPDTWRPLSAGLGQLAQAHGLRADPSVTQDSARVLRPIGSLHSAQKRVVVLKATPARYSPEGLAAKLPAQPAARKFDLSVNDDVTTSYEGPPSSAYKVAHHCGALREVAETGGDVPEPLWRAMIGLVKRCVEGIEVAQEWSQGYDGYDEREVERKFNGWTTGPTTCAEFSKHSKACASCQFRGKFKSPIGLGEMTTPEIEELPEDKQPAQPAPPVATGMPWDGHIPPRFEVVTQGQERTLVYKMQIEKESDTGDVVPVNVAVPVTHDIFWFTHWSEADHSDDSACVTLNLLRGGYVKTYDMDQTLVASPYKLLESLAGKSIHTTTHKRAPQAMQDYAKAMLQRIKTNGQRPKVTDHLGLRILDDGQLVAVQGKHVIYPDGSIREATLGGAVRGQADAMNLPIPPNFAGEWGAEVWAEHIEPRARKHVEFMRRHYTHKGLEKYQLAIMMALASPLMAFAQGTFHRGSKLPAQGLTVSLFSRDTARGKTAAIKAAMLAYGSPDVLSRDSNKTGSTDLARIAKMSIHGTVPLGMDEIGDLPITSMAQLVESVGNGTGRDRADRKGGLVESNGTWSLVALMAANRSAREMIAACRAESPAVQYRLIELNVDDMPEFDQETRETYSNEWSHILGECAGALGGVIHRAICALGAEQANRLVLECVNKASAAVKATQSARFQYRGLGMVLMLQTLLSRLGMQMFDTRTLLAEFKAAMDNSVEFIQENLLPTDPLELAQRMLSDLQPNTLVTEHESRPSGIVHKYDVMLNSRMPDPVLARHIVNLRKTYVSAAAVRKWCSDNRVSEMDMLRACKEQDVIGKIGPTGWTAPLNLLKGLKDNAGTRTRAYRFDTGRLNILTSVPLEFASADNVVEFPAPQARPDAPEEGDANAAG